MTSLGLLPICVALATLLISSKSSNLTPLQLVTERSANATGNVREHIKRVQKQMKCSLPQPRVVCMQTLLPNAGKRYVPECTILYVCNQDTGCCNPGKLCAPETQEKVKLHFSVITIGKIRPGIEIVTFVNHTRCGCRHVNEIERTTAKKTTVLVSGVTKPVTNGISRNEIWVPIYIYLALVYGLGKIVY